MSGFADSYVGRLRAIVGSRTLLVPGSRIVIVDRAGRILLQHRSDFGVWGIPGGSAEEGETLEAAIKREVTEETGLSVSDARPFGFASDPLHETIVFPNGDRSHFFTLMFYTRSFTGDLAIGDDESLALDWFKSDDLPQQMLPNMRRSVEAYRTFERTAEFQLI